MVRATTVFRVTLVALVGLTRRMRMRWLRLPARMRRFLILRAVLLFPRRRLVLLCRVGVIVFLFLPSRLARVRLMVWWRLSLIRRVLILASWARRKIMRPAMVLMMVLRVV